MTPKVIWLTTNDDNRLCVIIIDGNCRDHNTIYDIYTNRLKR